MKLPWLSVVMPTYNGARYLSQALESIQLQGDPSIEIIAIDDGSTDGTMAILGEYANRLPLQIVRKEHAGNWAASTNHGLKIARGEYVSFLHQDDLWLGGRLDKLRGLLAHHRDVGLILHPSWFINRHGRRLGLWHCPLPVRRRGVDAGLVIERLLVQNFIAIPAPLFQREAALAVGGLREELWFTADWDLWLQLARRCKTLYLPKPLAAFRLHSLSQTQARSGPSDCLRQQMAAVLDRHLPAWEASHPHRSDVRRAAWFSVEVNTALAAIFHHQWPAALRLAGCALDLGLEGWYRFWRDSRIVERLSARLWLRD
ncbi:MAG: glycosyltransferase [Gemmataceae bacterium]|nr:glycosyltransferase [Gemmataceae bacterium]